MFASQKSTASGYTTIVAYLVGAFIFSPAILAVWRPVGYTAISVAVACSALCLTLAWATWRKAIMDSVEREKAAK